MCLFLFGMPGTQWRPNFNKCKEAMLRVARVCSPASVYVCVYIYIYMHAGELFSVPQKALRELGTVLPRELGTVPPLLGGPLSHYKIRVLEDLGVNFWMRIF